MSLWPDEIDGLIQAKAGGETLGLHIHDVYNECMRNAAYKRLNITLPASTVAMIDSIADKGSRSAFIDDAVKIRVAKLRKSRLQNRLKEGAIARAEQNLKMAEEWFHLEEELGKVNIVRRGEGTLSF